MVSVDVKHHVYLRIPIPDPAKQGRIREWGGGGVEGGVEGGGILQTVTCQSVSALIGSKDRPLRRDFFRGITVLSQKVEFLVLFCVTCNHVVISYPV